MGILFFLLLLQGEGKRSIRCLLWRGSLSFAIEMPTTQTVPSSFQSRRKLRHTQEKNKTNATPNLLELDFIDRRYVSRFSPVYSLVSFEDVRQLLPNKNIRKDVLRKDRSRLHKSRATFQPMTGPKDSFDSKRCCCETKACTCSFRTFLFSFRMDNF